MGDRGLLDERIALAYATEDQRPVLVLRSLDDAPRMTSELPRGLPRPSKRRNLGLVRVGGGGYPRWIDARRELDRVVYEQRHGYNQRVYAYGYLLVDDGECPRWLGLYWQD